MDDDGEDVELECGEEMVEAMSMARRRQLPLLKIQVRPPTHGVGEEWENIGGETPKRQPEEAIQQPGDVSLPESASAEKKMKSGERVESSSSPSSSSPPSVPSSSSVQSSPNGGWSLFNLFGRAQGPTEAAAPSQAPSASVANVNESKQADAEAAGEVADVDVGPGVSEDASSVSPSVDPSAQSIVGLESVASSVVDLQAQGLSASVRWRMQNTPALLAENSILSLQQWMQHSMQMVNRRAQVAPTILMSRWWIHCQLYSTP